jgi:hypothetical protein
MARIRLALLWLAVSAAATVACFTGPSVGTFKPATTGHGVQTKLRVGRANVSGELLAIDDSSFVLLGSDGVLIVPFSGVTHASFSGFGSYQGGAPGGETERLQLVSRFPQGISARTMEALLSDSRQTSPRVVRP